MNVAESRLRIGPGTARNGFALLVGGERYGVNDVEPRKSKGIQTAVEDERVQGWTSSHGLTVRRDGTVAERVRGNLTRWIGDLHDFRSFGTLTLKTSHEQGCPCNRTHHPRHENHCNGTTNRLRASCRVPGVQQTETLVQAFIKHTDAVVVAEEFGAAHFRRHFHYVANGDETLRQPTWCFPCLRGKSGHTHTAVGFWRKYGGLVDRTQIDSTVKAIDYVLKAVGYTVKDSYSNDGEYVVNAAADASDGQRLRLWFKRGRGHQPGTLENPDGANGRATR